MLRDNDSANHPIFIENGRVVVLNQITMFRDQLLADYPQVQHPTQRLISCFRRFMLFTSPSSKVVTRTSYSCVVSIS